MYQKTEATGESQQLSAVYLCAVCGESIERDLLTFLRHTEHHILEALKEQHPDWVEGTGRNSQLLDVYRAQLGHDPWLRKGTS